MSLETFAYPAIIVIGFGLASVMSLWLLSRPQLLPLLYFAPLAMGELGRLADGLTVLKATTAWGIGLVLVLIARRATVPRIEASLGRVALYMAYLIANALLIGNAFGQQLAMTAVMSWGGPLILLYGIRRPKDVTLLMTLFWLSMLPAATATILEGMSLAVSQSGVSVVDQLRGTTYLADPNGLALTFALALTPAVTMNSVIRSRIVRTAGVGALTMAVLSTFSRTGAVLLVVLLILGPLVRRNSIRRQLREALLLGLLGLAAAPLVGSVLAERFSRATGDVSVLGRLWAASAGVNMWTSSPLWGVGLGRFQDLFARYASAGAQHLASMVAHNSYVELAAETGVIGLGLFLLVVLGEVVAWIRYRSVVDEVLSIRATVVTMWVLLLIAGLVLNVHFNKILWFLVAAGPWMRAALRRTHPQPTSRECLALVTAA